MSAEENKAIARRIPLEALNNKQLALLEELVDPAGVDHAVPPGMPETFETTKQFLGMLLAGFPDLRYTLEDEIAEGDKVVQRALVSGTMKGDFMGIPATGKHATWMEMHIVRFAGGKIVEHWATIDQLGMLQQLGVIPMPQ
jgi:predicted ester cyclase